MPVEIAYKICKNDTNLVSLYLFQFIAMKEIIGMDKMNKIKNDITILYSNLKETFEEIIKDKKWLDEETKNRIIKKLNSIEFFIPIPEKLDILEVDWEYKFLKIHPDHKYPVIKEILEYFFTLFDYNEYILARALYIQPNAGYNYLFNFIMASLGLLLEPVYGTKFMASLKFGGYGSILAHEILHGYSGRSLKYTEKFNFNDLLTDYSLKNYIKKAECIVNQYDNKTYKDSDFKASGLNTHTENISDNSGIKLAFIAYKKYVEKYGYEKNKMRTFGKYTNDQLFYISWAQYMCEIYKPSKVEYLFFEDSHLPGEMRIENTLKNQEGFAKAFNCKEGSKMNPKDKCEVWRYRKN
uniref:Peptidase_M13 domain-containing protein n=1 Tax=Parastrongyloides trichosuri TaxID=131310 RepID=A0A0N4Z7I9_PARTI